MMAIFKNPKAHRAPFGGAREWASDEIIRILLQYEIRARSVRGRIFDPNVINDSTWPILQRLFAAHLEGETLRTKELYVDSGLPQTTVLRYLDHLEKCEVVRRESDPADSRVTLVSLTEEGALWMREYYSRVVTGEHDLAKESEGVFSLRAGTERG